MRNKYFWWIVVVCVTPVVLSYSFYYGWRPEGRTNYGELLQPMPDANALVFANPASSGELSRYAEVRGKWVYLVVAGSECADVCQKSMWAVRQLRVTAGAERERVERLWLVSDRGTVAPSLLEAYAGVRVARAEAQALTAVLPVGAGESLQEQIYLIDPLGNVVLRYGRDADPNRMKKDLAKLLKASRIG